MRSYSLVKSIFFSVAIAMFSLFIPFVLPTRTSAQSTSRYAVGSTGVTACTSDLTHAVQWDLTGSFNNLQPGDKVSISFYVGANIYEYKLNNGNPVAAGTTTVNFAITNNTVAILTNGTTAQLTSIPTTYATSTVFRWNNATGTGTVSPYSVKFNCGKPIATPTATAIPTKPQVTTTTKPTVIPTISAATVSTTATPTATPTTTETVPTSTQTNSENITTTTVPSKLFSDSYYSYLLICCLPIVILLIIFIFMLVFVKRFREKAKEQAVKIKEKFIKKA